MDVKTPASWISWSFVGRSETREASDFHFYTSVPDHFLGSVKSTASEKSCGGKGGLFPVLPFCCLWPQNLYSIKFWRYPPQPPQWGLLSLNLTQIPCEAVCVWQQILKTIVNLQSIVKETDSPSPRHGACRPALRNTTSKDGGGSALAPACLACSPQDKKHFDLCPAWLSLLEAGHVRRNRKSVQHF